MVRGLNMLIAVTAHLGYSPSSSCGARCCGCERRTHTDLKTVFARPAALSRMYISWCDTDSRKCTRASYTSCNSGVAGFGRKPRQKQKLAHR
jgi:hypothetical protein